MDYITSQQDMNTAYYGGATGVLASGLVWGIAAIVGTSISDIASMLTLFVGGTLIFPLSMLFSKLLSRSGKHAPDNALKHLVMEGLGILFAGIFIAFTVAQLSLTLFYPIMLIT